MEGRTKSEGHLAQVLDVYRAAVDALAASGRFELWPHLAELQQTAKRPLTSGMFLPEGRRRVWLTPEAHLMRPLLAKVLFRDKPGRLRVAVRAPWDVEQDVEVLEPGLSRPLLPAGSYSLENDDGARLNRGHPGLELWLRCQRDVMSGCFLRQAA